jgi:hypothetical protein
MGHSVTPACRGFKRWVLAGAFAAVALTVTLFAYSVSEASREALAQAECAKVGCKIVKGIACHVAGKDGILTRPELIRLEQSLPSSACCIVRRSPSGKIIDPWNTPLEIAYENHSDGLLVRVRSAGPDRVFEGGDDIEKSFLCRGVQLREGKTGRKLSN